MSQSLKKWVVLLAFFTFYTQLSAQDFDKQIALEELVQQLFQQQEIPMNYEDFYEAMYQFYANPIDLNIANREELQALFILSPAQLNSFLDYRNNVGNLISEYELQAVPNFDLATIKKLIPFVEIKSKDAVKNRLFDFKNQEANTYLLFRISQKLEPSRGFTENKFLGSPQHIYSRFRSSKTKDYSLGFTLEKDAGEQLWWGDTMRSKGPDFFSFHGAIFNKGKLKSLVVGDYQLQFGQGLVLGAGFNFGKGAETITTVKRNNLGARPYTSVLEMNYFRGASATYTIFKNIDVTGFYSGKKIDGNLNNDTTLLNFEDYTVSSLINTGLHRTVNELANKKVISEKNIGSNISWGNIAKNIHVGYTALGTWYSAPVVKDTKGYSLYEFTGNRNLIHSLDGSWYFRNFNFFGEFAMSSSSGKAGTVGMLASLSPSVDFSFLYRNFGRNFHSMYARAFGENYRPINEQGLYWGIKIRPYKAITIAAYYDIFKFPWLKYRTDAPSDGNENLMRITWQPSKILVIYGQARFLNKQRNYADESKAIYFPENYHKANYLLHLDYKASDILSLRSRIQASSFEQVAPQTKGFYMMQELTVRTKGIAVSGRYALFDCDDYDNRQYVYEKDVLYAFSIPMIYGRGSRYYLLAQLRMGRHLDLWIKYIHTQYRNTETIGSGMDMVYGNTQREIRVQARWRL